MERVKSDFECLVDFIGERLFIFSDNFEILVFFTSIVNLKMLFSVVSFEFRNREK